MARRLVSEGLLPEDDVRKAMVDSTQHKVPLGAWLLDRNLVENAQLTRVLSLEFGMPMMDVTSLNPSTLPLDLISEALMTKHQALPLFRRGKRLFVGISDPTQSHALDEIKFHSNCLVEPILVERSSLQRTIENLLNSMRDTMPDMDTGEFDELDLEVGSDEAESTGIDANAADDAPVVKFVNKILVDAIRRGASDIHFEPFESQYRVRLRMDGMLKAVASPPMKMANRISSRLKVMAQLDIAEKRVPQDGRIKLNLSKTRAIDFRVSSLPTLFGEKIVLRILDGSAARIGIEKLGYEPEQQKLYVDAIHKPYGMVLVTGPTGSGKTVSLYTGLNMLNTAERNISTVEDPVEIRVEGIAIKAAQTGHMVLSTLHTNDAAQTIARLMNMGIAPYNITSSVTLIIAQRLARRLHECKKPIELPPKVLLDAGFSQADIDAGLTIYQAVGCEGCNEGYKGRVGIYQVMPMLEDIQKIILQGGNAMQIAEVAKAAGVNDLRASALLKVKQGLTSLTEIDRVTKE